MYLFKMASNGEALLADSDWIIHQSKAVRPISCTRRIRFYYHYYSEVTPEGRVVMMGRALSLAGPWKTKQLSHVRPAIDKEPNQGRLIEVPERTWYFVADQGTGDWEGRAGVLLQ